MTYPFAIIFDMDGVIVDSTASHTEAWVRYLRSHGIHIPNLESRMLGRHNDEIVRDFFPAADLDSEAIVQHGTRKEALYREIIAPELSHRLVPGIADFLKRMSARNIPLAVATNAEPANVDFVLDHAGIREYFEVIVTGEDVARPKPFPDVYLRAAELLNADPASCIVFEDSLTGVKAARAAGMRVAGLLTTLSEMDRVELTIRDFRDPALERWLDSMPAPVM